MHSMHSDRVLQKRAIQRNMNQFLAQLIHGLYAKCEGMGRGINDQVAS